jgi:hypothetical protein
MGSISAIPCLQSPLLALTVMIDVIVIIVVVCVPVVIASMAIIITVVATVNIVVIIIVVVVVVIAVASGIEPECSWSLPTAPPCITHISRTVHGHGRPSHPLAILSPMCLLLRVGMLVMLTLLLMLMVLTRACVTAVGIVVLPLRKGAFTSRRLRGRRHRGCTTSARANTVHPIPCTSRNTSIAIHIAAPFLAGHHSVCLTSACTCTTVTGVVVGIAVGVGVGRASTDDSTAVATVSRVDCRIRLRRAACDGVAVLGRLTVLRRREALQLQLHVRHALLEHLVHPCVPPHVRLIVRVLEAKSQTW